MSNKKDEQNEAKRARDLKREIGADEIYDRSSALDDYEHDIEVFARHRDNLLKFENWI